MSDPKNSEMLWCVHVSGPDEVLATADYFDAVVRANSINSAYEGFLFKRPLDDNWPREWASPAEWPHDAASHAASLAAPSTEYTEPLGVMTKSIADDAS